jgi:hypothetical protein
MHDGHELHRRIRGLVETRTNPDHHRCVAQYWEGKLDLKWSGVLVLVTMDSDTYKIPLNGSVQRVDASKVIVGCGPIDGAAGTTSTTAAGSGPTADSNGGASTATIFIQPTGAVGDQGTDGAANSSGGKIAGIVLGVAGGALLIGAIAFIFASRWRKKRRLEQQETAIRESGDAPGMSMFR